MKINEHYKSKDFTSQVSDFFNKEGYVQLQDFFIEKDALKIYKKLNKENFKLTFEPLEHKKYEIDIKKSYSPEILQIAEYFKSKEFIEYIESITDFSLQFKKLSINKYNHTCYELLSDSKVNAECIHVIFDISENWKKENGGTLVYTTSKEELLYLEPSFNSLSLVIRNVDILTYLKYINYKSKDNNIVRINIEYDFVEDLT